MTKNKKAFISTTLKETFSYNQSFYSGFYDGNYRRFLKLTLNEIYEKTSRGEKIRHCYEIMDFPECTHLRIVISIPHGWDAVRFLDIVLDKINNNPSVDVVLESFVNSSAGLEEKFFSNEWKGFSKVHSIA